MSDASQVQTGAEIENLLAEGRSFLTALAFSAQATATAALDDHAATVVDTIRSNSGKAED